MNQPQESMILQKIIGVLLRHVRQRAGRSQADMAASLHLPTSQYAQYEHGQREISLQELETVAELCEVPLGYFFDDSASVEDEGIEIPQMTAQRIQQKITGALLRQARHAAGKSQQETAAALGIPTRRLGEYESGEREVPISELAALAAYLGVDTSYFQ